MRTEKEIRGELDFVVFAYRGPVVDAVADTLRWILDDAPDLPREIVWTHAEDEDHP